MADYKYTTPISSLLQHKLGLKVFFKAKEKKKGGERS